MLSQASNISPDEINGSGCVDLLEDVTISWQVSGDTPLTGYEIVFYDTTAASVQLYTTGIITLDAPFWGVNYKGVTQRFNVTLLASALAAAGLANGGEYKFTIAQYTTDSQTPVTQTTPAFFYARTTPAVSIDSIADPVESRYISVTGAYAQAEDVPIAWARWQMAESSSQNAPFLDTGKIYGTGELQVDYDGLFTDTTYSVRLTVENAMGIQVSTDWVDFNVEYTVGEPIGSASACTLANEDAMFVQWDQIDVARGYSVFRQRTGDSVLEKIAEVGADIGQLRDYSARSGESYAYHIFPTGALAYLTKPVVTNTASVRYVMWSIIEAQQNADGSYTAVATHLFRMGKGGVSEGDFSNNNVPQLLRNFTPYPTWQPETCNYLTGSVSGYIGTINTSAMTYSDAVSDSKAIFALSTTQNELFLLNPKGHFLRIRVTDAISLSIDHAKQPRPQTMTVRWAEVGDTSGVSVYLDASGSLWPKDFIVSSRIWIDTDTGALMWETPDEYPLGSFLSLDEDGALIQTSDGAFEPAQMEIDYTTGILSATI